jgi:mediator of RNA polymerase II transcription subunit 13
MEFLKTCTTNAQAIVSARRPSATLIANKTKGSFEAVAYQAFSVTRATTPTSSSLRDWSVLEDTRAAEAGLRKGLHLVTQDASRAWLWLFKPTTVEKAGQHDVEPPELDGYRLQRR